MQIYADVTRLPLSVIGSEQGPALGSAIHAAVAAGAYPDVRRGRAAHGQGAHRAPTSPTRTAPLAYDRLFAEYLDLHDHFGRDGRRRCAGCRAIRRDAVGTTPRPPADAAEVGVAA